MQQGCHGLSFGHSETPSTPSLLLVTCGSLIACHAGATHPRGTRALGLVSPTTNMEPTAAASPPPEQAEAGGVPPEAQDSAWAWDKKVTGTLLRLRDCETLVSLLAHAGDTLESLVPRDGAPGPEADTDVFEEKGQQWLVTLNEVQTTLKTAIFQLRQANVMPLTPNLSSEARISGTLGAADPAPVDFALLRHALAGALATEPDQEPSSSQPDALRLLSPEDAALSLSALRLEERAWSDLAAALRDVSQLRSSGDGPRDPSAAQPGSNTSDADRRLVDAILAQK